VVDPNDDQTMWAFEDFAYSTSATDAWGVRAIKLVAPPPATLVSVNPSIVNTGAASLNITVTGSSSGGSGFFDPGPGYANRLTASVSGGVIVNSVTFVNPTT